MYEKYLSGFYSILKNVSITDETCLSINLESALEKIYHKFDDIKLNNRIVFLIGNGGSSGIVSHTSVDLLNTCKINAHPITDNSQITCFANDFGYEQVYSKPLETFLTSNDLLIAVSSSGSSKNIINAAQVAKMKGCFILTLSGFKSDNPLRKMGCVNFWLESNHYGTVEVGHTFLLHYITDTYCNLF